MAQCDHCRICGKPCKVKTILNNLEKKDKVICDTIALTPFRGGTKLVHGVLIEVAPVLGTCIHAQQREMRHQYFKNVSEPLTDLDKIFTKGIVKDVIRTILLAVPETTVAICADHQKPYDTIEGMLSEMDLVTHDSLIKLLGPNYTVR
jgi:hypothetical protein